MFSENVGRNQLGVILRRFCTTYHGTWYRCSRDLTEEQRTCTNMLWQVQIRPGKQIQLLIYDKGLRVCELCTCEQVSLLNKGLRNFNILALAIIGGFFFGNTHTYLPAICSYSFLHFVSTVNFKIILQGDSGQIGLN